MDVGTRIQKLRRYFADDTVGAILDIDRNDVRAFNRGGAAPTLPGGSSSPLTSGFSYTPDAIYTDASPEIGFGTNFLVGADPVKISRWGTTLTFGATGVKYASANIGDYGFYNAPIITFPTGWVPAGNPADANDLPPFGSIAGRIIHLASDDSTKEIDSTARYALSRDGSGNAGISLMVENLTSLAAGDYLVFNFQAGQLLLLPEGADFTPA
jgi:hypothetical protein